MPKHRVLDTSIFIGNLPNNVTLLDISQLFKGFPLTYVVLPPRATFCSVGFQNSKYVQLAIDSFDGYNPTSRGTRGPLRVHPVGKLPSYNKKSSVYVGNLPPHVVMEDVARLFSHHQCGPGLVTSIDLEVGKDWSSAVVSFEFPDQCPNAIERLDNTLFMNRHLIVSFAKDMDEITFTDDADETVVVKSKQRQLNTTICLDDLPDRTTLMDVALWLAHFQVTYIAFPAMATSEFCHVGFEDPLNMERAVKHLRQNDVNVSPVKRLLNFDRNTSVFVGHLSTRCSLKDVACLIHSQQEIGSLYAIDFMRTGPDWFYAFAGFQDPKDCLRAITLLNGLEFFGNKVMVDFTVNSSNPFTIALKTLQLDANGYTQVHIGSAFVEGILGGEAAIAVIFGSQHPLNVLRKVKGSANRNVAKFEAATEAARFAKACGMCKLQINCDDDFIQSCLSWWCDERSRRVAEYFVDHQQIEKLWQAMHGMDIVFNVATTQRDLQIVNDANWAAHTLCDS